MLERERRFCIISKRFLTGLDFSGLIKMQEEIHPQVSENNTLFYFTSLIAGGVAGTVVDVALFPIDTLKTRIQSEKGFFRSGGFKGLYRGLAPAAAGSAPTAAIFFCSYEYFKKFLGSYTEPNNAVVHMASASIAEVIACLIRVPVELAKQRRQAMANKSAIEILVNEYKRNGIVNGIYKGFSSTIFREIPFSFIQFPIWEYLKLNWTDYTGTPLTSVSVAICGAFAGGVAAAITTPLDVIKTRVMLSEEALHKQQPVTKIVKSIYLEKGIKGLFAGIVPRVTWITCGGAVFFGFYNLTTELLKKLH